MSWLCPYLRQSDPRWRDEECGNGEHTIGAVGCLLVSLTQAARNFAVVPPDFSPLELNEAGKARGAFHGSGAIIPALAMCAGLQAPATLRVNSDKGAKAMTDCLLATLEAGWCALLHVDHDSAKPRGDLQGDHWILAIAFRGGEVICSDPATGRVCKIDPVGLRGLSEWGSGIRTYEVRGVVPVGPASRPAAA